MNSDLKIEMSPIYTADLEQNFSAIISQLMENNLLEIRKYILDNLASLDGGPSVNGLQVSNLQYNSAKKTGSFRLKFQIDRQFCCSDMQACANDYLDFDFKVEEKTLLAHTEYFDWSLTN